MANALPALTQNALAESMKLRRPVAGRTEGPLVSIVIITRDGAHHLKRLFGGLAGNTNYRNFEVIVVDNGSTDDTATVLEQSWPFAVSTVVNDGNSTFSIANNQGIDLAQGEFVLLLNNDIDPINASWLGCLVDSMIEDESLAAVGALLVYPERQFGEGQKAAHPDLTIQHNGLFFRWRNGAIRAGNLDAGSDPLGPACAATRLRPGATAACLLTRRDVLNTVGGLPEGYIYGSEDWDLCLRLKEHGNIAVVGAASLFHHEYGTQREFPDAMTTINRTDNRYRFVEKWGPRLMRDLRLEMADGGKRWNPEATRTLAIASTAKHHDLPGTKALTRAMAERGWTIRMIQPGDGDANGLLDVLITTDPTTDWARYSNHTVKVAWILDQIDNWESIEVLEHFHEVFVEDPIHVDRIAAALGSAPELLLPATDTIQPSTSASDPVYECDFLLIGNRRSADQALSKKIEIRDSERMIVFGEGWETDPRFVRYTKGKYDPGQHADIVRSAKLFIHSAQGPQRLSSATQVLEALLAGALPLTDDFEMSQWLFDGLLPVFATRQEFRALADRFLTDEAQRRHLLSELQQIVFERHTYTHRAATIEKRLLSGLVKPTVAIKISPPNRRVATNWGDTHFARQFAKALRRVGFNTQIHILPQWDSPDSQWADLVVHIRGLDSYVPKPGAINIMWIVSHPDDVTPEECNQYDIVFVASESFAAELQEQTKVPVFPLLQATDPDVFRPAEPNPDLHADVLFLGNARWPARVSPRWAMELDAPLVIIGANWTNFPENKYVRDTYFPNERLAELYGSADIILNDHWPDMKNHGFVANRLFDVLACGGFVISDYVPGMETLFGDIVPTFRTKAEFTQLLDEFSQDPGTRSKLSSMGIAHVRRHHSFNVRAQQFLEVLAETIPTIPLDVRGSLVAHLKVMAGTVLPSS